MRIDSFDAVAFDMDGVIFDSERCVADCWTFLADKYGLPDVDKILLQTLGTNERKTKEIVLSIWGEDFPYEKFAKEGSIMYHERCDGGKLPMMKGVKEILTFLRESDKKIALASSTRKAVVESQLRDAGIIDFFDVIIGGDLVEHSKPAPDIYLMACEALGSEPGRTFAIEDSYNGIRSASAGGLRPIMVPDMVPPTEEMNELAETISDSLMEVIEYMK